MVEESRRFRLQSAALPPVLYAGVSIAAGLRLDLLVDDRVIVEIKACDSLHSIHTAQNS